MRDLFLNRLYSVLWRFVPNALYEWFNRRHFWIWDKGRWCMSYPVKIVQYENVIASKLILSKLLYDIHIFMRSKTLHKLMQQFNISLMQSVLIEGVQGSDKKELVLMIASSYQKHVYDFSHINTSKQLERAMRKMHTVDGIMLFRIDSIKQDLVKEFCLKISEIDWKYPTLCIILNETNSYMSRLPLMLNHEVYLESPDEEQLGRLYQTMLGGNDRHEKKEFVKHMLKTQAPIGQIRKWLLDKTPDIIDQSKTAMQLLNPSCGN